MPKQKKFTPLSDIEKEIQNKTRNLYEKTPPLSESLAHADTVAATSGQRQKRRNRPESIIPRENGKLLFLEERHNKAIEQIHWTSKADRQDVIRTAIDDFLSRHYNGERLNAEGQEKLKAYYDKTHK